MNATEIGTNDFYDLLILSVDFYIIPFKMTILYDLIVNLVP